MTSILKIVSVMLSHLMKICML